MLWTAPHVDLIDPFESYQYGPSEPVRHYGGVALRSRRDASASVPGNQPGNDDSYLLYGTWPVELASSTCTTLAGIGVHRPGIFAASLGFSV